LGYCACISTPEAQEEQKAQQTERKPGNRRRTRPPAGQQSAQLLDRLERQAKELGQLQERVLHLERERDTERRQREQLEGALDRQTEKLRRRNAELETHLQAAWTQLEALRDDDRMARQRRSRFKFRREPDLVQDS
jgi:septal ring factor EnvC (AmiA/AmiB activator)